MHACKGAYEPAVMQQFTADSILPYVLELHGTPFCRSAYSNSQLQLTQAWFLMALWAILCLG